MAKSKARQALEFYRGAARLCLTSQDLHNVFFGIGGKVSQLFPTYEDRKKFWKSPEFAEIDRIRDAVEANEEAAAAATCRKKRSANSR